MGIATSWCSRPQCFTFRWSNHAGSYLCCTFAVLWETLSADKFCSAAVCTHPVKQWGGVVQMKHLLYYVISLWVVENQLLQAEHI